MRAWLLLLLSAGCVRYVPLPKEAEPHRAVTRDGWEIALVRYRPVGIPTGRPVVMVPGISANARNMDLDDRHSMARWFAAHGREAWTVSLRSAGDSDTANAEFGRKPGFNFDAYWEQDLPAVIALVQKLTGADSVDYVGHSMGGMLAYAYLSQGGKGIHAAATLGSPSRLDLGTGFEGVLEKGAKFIPGSWMVPSSTGAWLAAPFQGLIDDGPFQRFFYIPGNTELEAWKRLMAYGTAPVSGAVAGQLVSIIATGDFTSADGTRNFREGLHQVTTPVLVVAGRLDRVALSPAVYDAYRALGGPKEWLLISRANGTVAEYGHMDLVIGERAPTEVWTPVLEFFNRHAEKETP